MRMAIANNNIKGISEELQLLEVLGEGTVRLRLCFFVSCVFQLHNVRSKLQTACYFSTSVKCECHVASHLLSLTTSFFCLPCTHHSLERCIKGCGVAPLWL